MEDTGYGYKLQNNSIKENYEKPILVKVEKMTFPMEAIKNFSLESKISCRQCSGCHGCR
jgi:hypothetical protein